MIFGITRVRIIFIDTHNENADTYRFLKDCEKWYGKRIEILTNSKYKSIWEVWRKFNSLNVATGAICSSELKRAVRIQFEKENFYTYQIFGYDIDEPKRAKSMTLNNPNSKPLYILLLFGYTKIKCIEILSEYGIEIPEMYKRGYDNNNCDNTGCIQGGIDYWKRRKKELPDSVEEMANFEWELSAIAGRPITILKDQSKEAKESGNVLVFLKKNPAYPNLKCLDEMTGRSGKALIECNGFCGTMDLEKKTGIEQETNYDDLL